MLYGTPAWVNTCAETAETVKRVKNEGDQAVSACRGTFALESSRSRCRALPSTYDDFLNARNDVENRKESACAGPPATPFTYPSQHVCTLFRSSSPVPRSLRPEAAPRASSRSLLQWRCAAFVLKGEYSRCVVGCFRYLLTTGRPTRRLECRNPEGESVG
jgi:hypothetical protein